VKASQDSTLPFTDVSIGCVNIYDNVTGLYLYVCVEVRLSIRLLKRLLIGDLFFDTQSQICLAFR